MDYLYNRELRRTLVAGGEDNVAVLPDWQNTPIREGGATLGG
jgi:hypothetical protein